MVKVRISKHLDKYSEALTKVIKSYPSNTIWATSSLMAAMNKFLSPTCMRLGNGIQVAFILRNLKLTGKFNILRESVNGTMAKYSISSTKRK